MPNRRRDQARRVFLQQQSADMHAVSLLIVIKEFRSTHGDAGERVKGRFQNNVENRKNHLPQRMGGDKFTYLDFGFNTEKRGL